MLPHHEIKVTVRYTSISPHDQVPASNQLHGSPEPQAPRSFPSERPKDHINAGNGVAQSDSYDDSESDGKIFIVDQTIERSI